MKGVDMNKPYSIHPKHFYPMNHTSWTHFNQYREMLDIKEEQDTIAAYCNYRDAVSFLVFDYEDNEIDEYDIQTRKLLATYRQPDLIRLKPITEFFKDSIFVPTLSRHETTKDIHYSLDLQDQKQDAGSLYFIQEGDPYQMILSSLKLGIHQPYLISNKLAVYSGLLKHFDFKLSRQYNPFQLTFTKVEELIEIKYRKYRIDTIPATMQDDIVFQKHVNEEQQSISFYLKPDHPQLFRKYVSQCINVLADMITLDNIPRIIEHIRTNNHFMYWLKEEESNPSDNHSK